jgi:hypothetical protein
MTTHYDLDAYRGDPFEVDFIFYDGVEGYTEDPQVFLDLTGLTPEASFKYIGDDTEHAFTIDVSGSTVTISLNRTETAALVGAANWDLQMVDGNGDPHTWFKGVLNVDGQVTT